MIGGTREMDDFRDDDQSTVDARRAEVARLTQKLESCQRSKSAHKRRADRAAAKLSSRPSPAPSEAVREAAKLIADHMETRAAKVQAYEDDVFISHADFDVTLGCIRALASEGERDG